MCDAMWSLWIAIEVCGSVWVKEQFYICRCMNTYDVRVYCAHMSMGVYIPRTTDDIIYSYQVENQGSLKYSLCLQSCAPFTFKYHRGDFTSILQICTFELQHTLISLVSFLPFWQKSAKPCRIEGWVTPKNVTITAYGYNTFHVTFIDCLVGTKNKQKWSAYCSCSWCLVQVSNL